jgi:hypothetical protein
MTPCNLIWQLSWRSTVWAVFMSALVLSIYISSLMMVVLVINAIMHGWDNNIHGTLSALRFLMLAALLGGGVGAVVGLIVGILTGLLASAITLHYFMPHPSGARYRQVIACASALVGSLGTLVGAPLLIGYFLDRPTTETAMELLLFSALPALLVGLAIWRSSGQVTMWYVRRAKPIAPMQPRDVHLPS